MSPRLLLPLMLVACGHASTSPAPAAPAAAPAVGDLGVDAAHLEARLAPFIASIGSGDPLLAFSGYVLLAQHDQVIFSHAYGAADRASQLPANADTSFRVGSVTKQFTAAAVLLLEQRGKLSVTERVRTYLPEYPGPGKDATLHQLLTHTAGIPEYLGDLTMARRAQRFSVAELMALFWEKPLDFSPGARFSYSNSGYVILGAIIERVSGQPYGDFLAKNLFAPAGMARTIVGDAAGLDNRAAGYQLRQGAITEAEPLEMSFAFAAGAVRSTAADLVRWHRALAGDAILGPAARAKLVHPGLHHYAYGWVAAEVRGHPALWHNGLINGFSTMYWRVPDADLVAVVWSNVPEVAADLVGQTAVETALGGTPKLFDKIAFGAVDPTVTARMSGEFVLSDSSKAALQKQQIPQAIADSVASIVLIASPHGLTLQPNGQGPLELAPTAEGDFYHAGAGVRLRYQLPPSGPLPRFSLEQGTLTLEYQRR